MIDWDLARSRSSFRPREIDLTKIPTGELGKQRNIGEETRSKVTQKKFLGCGVLASINHFSFRWTRERYHVKRADIQICFDRYSKISDTNPGDISGEPIVRNLGPRKIYGVPNTNGQKWSLNVEQICEALPSPSLKNATEKKAFLDGCRLEVIGKPWSDSRRRKTHKGCWIVTEFGNKNYGIPDELRLGMIVEYSGSFQATVKVAADIPLMGNLFGFPWPVDDPILFMDNEPRPVIGGPLRTSQFDTLLEDDWTFLLLGHRDTDSIDHSSASIEPAAPRIPNSRTYRAQWVGEEHEVTDVKDLLESVLSLQKKDSDIELRSLTICPDVPAARVVTFQSSLLGSVLGTGTHWEKHLPPSAEESSVIKRQYVIFDTNFLGFTCLSGGSEDYDYEIIALAGLGAHAFGSFKERHGDHMWLRDDAAFDFPRARILIYGCDTKLAGSQSFQDFDSLAITFRTALKTIRHDTVDSRPNEKPIIFIAHSLGGIILKQALIQMADGDQRDQAYAKATRGILFFGVPSQGMDISSLRTLVRGQPNEFLISNLREDSDVLRRQTRDFRQKFPHESCRIISFYETELSRTARQASLSEVHLMRSSWRTIAFQGASLLIFYCSTQGPHGLEMTGEPTVLVTQASATCGSRARESELKYTQPIERSHSELVKFYPRDPCYALVKYMMSDVIEAFYPSSQTPMSSTSNLKA